MLTRTWPYGTVKHCDVIDVIREPKFTLLICHADDDPSNEAHVCIYRPDDVTAEKGDRGRLVFTRGGPTGGYWKFSR